ncbi:unnamed protein product [Closterium sp. NIES-53]
MEVARTSMIHAAAPHFLWPFAVRYAAHQLNLWRGVSLPETSPTLRWTGEVGDASVFRVWGSRAFVRDTSADKLSSRAIPCVFLGFVPKAPSWQFYHPTSRRVFPSRDVTFDESVSFYRLSEVHPLPVPAPVQVAIDSSAARGVASGGATSGGAEPGGAESKGAGSGGAEPGGEEPGGAEPVGVEPEGAEPGGAESEGAESGGAEPRGAASSGGPAGASPRLSSQKLREWFVWHPRLQSGAIGAGGTEDAGAGGAGVIARAGGDEGAAATGPRGARTKGTGAAKTCGIEGAGAGDPTKPGAAGAGGTGAGGAGAGGAGAAGAGAVYPGAGGARDTVPLQPASPQPAPSPYNEQSGGLTERREPASHPISPIRNARRVPHSRPPVPGTHAMALHPSSVPLRVPLPAPPQSSLPAVPDPQSDRARAASPTTTPLLLLLCLRLPAFGFAPATADPSLFLRTDTSLPPFYVLVYVDDLVFVTAATEALTLVKSELQKRHTCTDLGELRSYLGLQITRDRARRTITLTQSHMVHQVLQRFGFQFSSPQPTPLSTSHSLSAPPSDESVEPSGPYPELVGCLITSGMGLVLGGRGPVVLIGHTDASWVDDSATQRSSQGYTFSLGSGSVSWRSTRSSSVLSSSCEAEIYAGAMAAQELRWLAYLPTDLGEQPCSPPVLYVDNKAMIALCQERRLEHRTKHIALRYFLARELQQRGQLRLAYVATRANTADIFTKALPPGDHQRFSTVLGLLALLFFTGLLFPFPWPTCSHLSPPSAVTASASSSGPPEQQEQRQEGQTAAEAAVEHPSPCHQPSPPSQSRRSILLAAAAAAVGVSLGDFVSETGASGARGARGATRGAAGGAAEAAARGAAVAATITDRPMEAYDEQRLLEQNRRIQRLNQAPENFPAFIRQGFEVKVVTGPEYLVSPTGLIYWDIVEGQGEPPSSGQEVEFNYIGFNESGRRVDSTYLQGRPAKTRVGINGMIPGFEEGISGMKAGGRRRIIIPPELGPPTGPSTFFSAKQYEVFDIELLAIRTCERRQIVFYSDVVCQ